MATLGQTIALSTLEITATAPATFDEAGWDAIADFVQIKEITNFGGHGDTYTPVTYTTVEDRREKTLKGSKTGGNESLTMVTVIDDAGQALVRTALDSDADYYFKETWQDGTVEYYPALVMSAPGTGGDSNTVRSFTVDLAINGDQLLIAA